MQINLETNKDSQLELGKKSSYDSHYNPAKLFALSRKTKRQEIGISGVLPFFGYDIWNHYEVSWLNQKGKPQVAIAEISYPCDSPNIIESKSMKLYFNSLNNTSFIDTEQVRELIQQDIAKCVGSPVQTKLIPLSHYRDMRLSALPGTNIDDLDIEVCAYEVAPELLSVENKNASETLCSDLLKSNCLVTGQPDWGSVSISYSGKQINHIGLLKYIISFRNHNEFHEQCIERIFIDIMRRCKPDSLTVYGRYTRRGGIDINPIRSTAIVHIDNKRNIRQ